MSKTIKVIDILNKRANGENIPKQIKYRANLYRLDENKIYRDVVDGSYFVEDLNFDLANLNDEVEIIEEQQDIDIQEIEQINLSSTPTKYEVILNKLVQAVKQLDNKMKEINNK